MIAIAVMTISTVYAPNVQVKSADLNKFVAIYNAMYAQEQTLGVSFGRQIAGSTTINSDDTVTIAAAGVTWRVPLPPMTADAMLTSLIVRASADAAVTGGFVLRHEGLASGADFTDDIPLQAMADVAIAGVSSGTPFVLTAGYRYYIDLLTPGGWGGSNYSIDQVRYTLRAV